MEKCLVLCAEIFDVEKCGMKLFFAGSLVWRSWWRQKRISEYLAKSPTAACRGQSSRFLLVFYVNLVRNVASAKAFKLNLKLNFLRLLWNSPRVDWWNLNQKSPLRGREARVSDSLACKSVAAKLNAVLQRCVLQSQTALTNAVRSFFN